MINGYEIYPEDSNKPTIQTTELSLQCIVERRMRDLIAFNSKSDSQLKELELLITLYDKL